MEVKIEHAFKSQINNLKKHQIAEQNAYFNQFVQLILQLKPLCDSNSQNVNPVQLNEQLNQLNNSTISLLIKRQNRSYYNEEIEEFNSQIPEIFIQPQGIERFTPLQSDSGILRTIKRIKRKFLYTSSRSKDELSKWEYLIKLMVRYKSKYPQKIFVHQLNEYVVARHRLKYEKIIHENYKASFAKFLPELNSLLNLVVIKVEDNNNELQLHKDLLIGHIKTIINQLKSAQLAIHRELTDLELEIIHEFNTYFHKAGTVELPSIAYKKSNLGRIKNEVKEFLITGNEKFAENFRRVFFNHLNRSIINDLNEQISINQNIIKERLIELESNIDNRINDVDYESFQKLEESIYSLKIISSFDACETQIDSLLDKKTENISANYGLYINFLTIRSDESIQFNALNEWHSEMQQQKLVATSLIDELINQIINFKIRINQYPKDQQVSQLETLKSNVIIATNKIKRVTFPLINNPFLKTSKELAFDRQAFETDLKVLKHDLSEFKSDVNSGFTNAFNFLKKNAIDTYATAVSFKNIDANSDFINQNKTKKKVIVLKDECSKWLMVNQNNFLVNRTNFTKDVINAAMNDNNNTILIIGQKSTGKTTLLNRLKYYFEKDNISCHTLNDSYPENHQPKGYLFIDDFQCTAKKNTLELEQCHLKWMQDKCLKKIISIDSKSPFIHKIKGNSLIFEIPSLNQSEWDDLNNKIARLLNITMEPIPYNADNSIGEALITILGTYKKQWFNQFYLDEQQQEIINQVINKKEINRSSFDVSFLLSNQIIKAYDNQYSTNYFHISSCS